MNCKEKRRGVGDIDDKEAGIGQRKSLSQPEIRWETAFEYQVPERAVYFARFFFRARAYLYSRLIMQKEKERATMSFTRRRECPSAAE